MGGKSGTVKVRDGGSALLGLCQTLFMFAQTLYLLSLPFLKWEDPPAPTARHILKDAVEELSHCTDTGDLGTLLVGFSLGLEQCRR